MYNWSLLEETLKVLKDSGVDLKMSSMYYLPKYG